MSVSNVSIGPVGAPVRDLQALNKFTTLVGGMIVSDELSLWSQTAREVEGINLSERNVAKFEEKIEETTASLLDATDHRTRRIIISYLIAFVIIVAIAAIIAGSIFSFGAAPLAAAIVAVLILPIVATIMNTKRGYPNGARFGEDRSGPFLLIICFILSPLLLIISAHGKEKSLQGRLQKEQQEKAEHISTYNQKLNRVIENLQRREDGKEESTLRHFLRLVHPGDEDLMREEKAVLEDLRSLELK